jgi:hypothetical protein
MGIGWLWLLDVDQKSVETFANERGRMLPGPKLAAGQPLVAPPFGDLSTRVQDLFLP